MRTLALWLALIVPSVCSARDAQLEARAALALARAQRERSSQAATAAPAAKANKPQEASGLITVRIDHERQGQGTATVIRPKRPDGKWNVLTAAHVVRGHSAATLHLGDKKVALRVVSIDQGADVAWLVTDAAHDWLPSAELGPAPRPGDRVWHVGLGTKKRCEGTVARDTNDLGSLFAVMQGTFGDSGAAIFDESGRVVGVLTGSPNHDAPAGVKKIIGAGLSRIRDLLKRPVERLRRHDEPHPDGGGWRWHAEWNCWYRERPVAKRAVTLPQAAANC